MAEAAKHLWILSKDETLQELAMVKERDRKDQAAREEGAYEEGMKKGRKEGMEKVAQNMLKENLNISLISTMTGLSKDDILKLKK